VNTWRAIIKTRDSLAGCRVQAMADGVRALGGEPLFTDPDRSDRVRFVVCWGHHPRDAAFRARWRGLGVPLLIMELGYLRRCAGSGDPDGYSQLGFGGIGWIPPRAPDAARFESLGLDVAQPVQGRGKQLLVLGQVPHDAQHNLGPEALAGWLTEEAAVFAAQNWEILYRPHPKHTITTLRLPHVRLDEGTLSEAFSKVGAVLTYNSTAGIEAMIAGLPVHCHPSAHYAEVASYLAPFDKFSADRNAVLSYLHRLAWAQWSCAELARGAPLQFLGLHGDGPLAREALA